MSKRENASVVLVLPPFDTGQYQGCEFLMSGGDAVLTLLFVEIARIQIRFSRVRWHEFAAVYNCSLEQVKDAYFRLVEVEDSQRLNEFLRGDRAPKRAYRELHH
jgi:hypothetical protein